MRYELGVPDRPRERAMLLRMYRIFIFFQAKDGIRDYKVTGVQTCALPILGKEPLELLHRGELVAAGRRREEGAEPALDPIPRWSSRVGEIERALRSVAERVPSE